MKSGFFCYFLHAMDNFQCFRGQFSINLHQIARSMDNFQCPISKNKCNFAAILKKTPRACSRLKKTLIIKYIIRYYETKESVCDAGDGHGGVKTHRDADDERPREQ